MTSLGHSLRRPVAIVLGCGDIGSAVALALHEAGHAVVLVDEADPAWHRRGMSFTNAWYLGNAELEGEGACFCASLKSIPSVLSRSDDRGNDLVLAGRRRRAGSGTARGRARSQTTWLEVLRGHVPMTIGIGDDFVAGENVDTAIALPPDPPRGPPGSVWESVKAMDPIPRGPIGGSRPSVAALRHGRFITERRIGDAVQGERHRRRPR